MMYVYFDAFRYLRYLRKLLVRAGLKPEDHRQMLTNLGFDRRDWVRSKEWVLSEMEKSVPQTTAFLLRFLDDRSYFFINNTKVAAETYTDFHRRTGVKRKLNALIR